MENKTEKIELPKTYPPSVNVAPSSYSVQNEFRYGKNQEKLSKKQISGTFGYFAVGSGSRSTTGTQSFTVGFKPKLVKIKAVYAANPGSFSDGAATASAQTCVYTFPNPTAGQWTFNTSNCAYVDWAGTGTSVATVTFETKGFSLVWATIGPPVYFFYECYA